MNIVKDIINKPITCFHAHIYFDLETRSKASEFRDLIGQDLGSKLLRFCNMVDKNIGPHLKPMFEINFTFEHFGKIVNFLMQNHGDLSVLIHPETGNDLIDHTTHALWLGKQLPLDLGRL